MIALALDSNRLEVLFISICCYLNNFLSWCREVSAAFGKDYMKLGWKTGLLLLGGIVFGAAPAIAVPDFTGSWRFTFYSGPNRTTAATQCVVFKATGNIAGQPKSGTWTSSTFSSWKGQWIQEGPVIHWYGTTGSSLATADQGEIVSPTSAAGSGESILVPSGTTSTFASWTATKVSNCSTPSAVQSNSGDPRR